MPNKRILEVIACSLADAIAAEDGGADRLEVCARLDLQGLTPPVDLVASVLQAVKVPVRVMIRAPDDDVARMESQIQEFAGLPFDGVIFGVLDAGGALDFPAMDRVLRHTSLPWTLHRYFDYATGNANTKLAQVAAHGRADRILTAASWNLRPPPGLQFIAGGGLTAENLNHYMNSPCREFHVGRAARTPAETTAPVDRQKVRKLSHIIQRYPIDMGE